MRTRYVEVVQVECSCGDRTGVVFRDNEVGHDGKPGGRYVPANPRWKFKAEGYEYAERLAVRRGHAAGWVAGVAWAKRQPSKDVARLL